MIRILSFLATSLNIIFDSAQAMQGIKKEYPTLKFSQLML